MKFGDVVNYNGKEYVYLAQTVDIVYLAKIVDGELSKKLIAGRDRVFTMGSRNMVAKQQSTAWCFVVLSTEEFRERVAHYLNHQCTFEDLSTVLGVLSLDDQKKIKKEIAEDSAVSGVLRSLVKDIVIEGV